MAGRELHVDQPPSPFVSGQDTPAEQQEALRYFALTTFPISRCSLQKFAHLFYEITAQSNNPDFVHLNILVNKIAFQNSQYRQTELFDNVRQQIIRSDASAISAVLQYFAAEPQRPSSQFLAAVRQWVNKQTRNKLNEDDIAVLEPVLTAEYADDRVADTYLAIFGDINLNYLHEQSRDVNTLNNWAFGYREDELVPRLAFRSTYLNLLYERLVCGHNIKNINPQKYFLQQQFLFREMIKETGKMPDPKKETLIGYPHARNKVYKQISNRDNFHLAALRTALQKRHVNSDFYEDCAAILDAIEGGAKNRDVKIPLRPYRQYD